MYNSLPFNWFSMIVEVNDIRFILDPTDELLGSIHQQLINDFQDVAKLEKFKSLLVENQDTAFNLYCEENV